MARENVSGHKDLLNNLIVLSNCAPTVHKARGDGRGEERDVLESFKLKLDHENMRIASRSFISAILKKKKNLEAFYSQAKAL